MQKHKKRCDLFNKKYREGKLKTNKNQKKRNKKKPHKIQIDINHPINRSHRISRHEWINDINGREWRRY